MTHLRSQDNSTTSTPFLLPKGVGQGNANSNDSNHKQSGDGGANVGPLWMLLTLIFLMPWCVKTLRSRCRRSRNGDTANNADNTISQENQRSNQQHIEKIKRLSLKKRARALQDMFEANGVQWVSVLKFLNCKNTKSSKTSLIIVSPKILASKR